MTQQELLKKIEEIQESVRLMKEDDLLDNPEAANDEFQCDCCADIKSLAGSMIYDGCRLCNDCVLIAEVGLELGKIKSVDELMDSMEDKRFEKIYDAIFNAEEINGNNMN